MCWQGKMHLGTLEMSLRDFDEELFVFRVFQSVRGLVDDSVTRLDKNEDLALEMRDLTELHCARNFLRSKGDFQRRQHASLKSTAFPLGLENFGVNPWSMGSLDNCFGFNWGMDVENGSEGGGKLICKVGCIGSWLCVERGSKNVIFEVVNNILKFNRLI